MRYTRPKEGKPEWYIPVRWDGHSRLFFVAAQPSSRGEFPSVRDKRFWNIAVEHGLARHGLRPDASITDAQVYYKGPFATELVPRRAPVSKAEDLQRWPSSKWVAGFLREVGLADPVLLVAMGSRVYEALRQLPNLDIPIERVTHHGYFARKDTLKEATKTLNREFARVRKVYDKLLR